MNYQINLLLPSERRSGSQVSRKFIIRVALVMVPVIIAFGVLILMATAKARRVRLQGMKDQWVLQEPVYKSVLSLQQEKKRYEDMANVAEGWRQTRMDLSEVLRGLQETVPPTIQLTQLTLNETYGASPGRAVAMLLMGNVGGDHPESDVQNLSDGLRNAPSFSNVVENVSIVRYAAYQGPAGEGQTLKVFEIECRFRPRPIAPVP